MFSCFLVPKARRSCANLVHGTLTVSESWWDECTNKLLTPTMICFQVKQNEIRKRLFTHSIPLSWIRLHVVTIPEGGFLWLDSLCLPDQDSGRVWGWPAAHHVHDLLQRQPELEHHGLGLVGDRPLEVLVWPHEVIDEPPLVRASHNYWKIQRIIMYNNYPSAACPDCSISGGF